jgi:hypothetical protein
VARDLVRGVERRTFSVWTGLDGFMLSSLTCGMEPCFSLLAGLVQVLTCSLFRFVSLFYLLDFYRISHRCSAERHTAQGKDANGAPRKYMPRLPGSHREPSSPKRSGSLLRRKKQSAK